MTNEELLQPRWKVIASFPDNGNYLVGSILDRDWCRYVNDEDESEGVVWRISYFPHLFKELKWWEERVVNDLPLYLKNPYNGNVHKVIHYKLENKKVNHYLNGIYKLDYIMHFMPATETEYLAGLNKQI